MNILIWWIKCFIVVGLVGAIVICINARAEKKRNEEEHKHVEEWRKKHKRHDDND